MYFSFSESAAKDVRKLPKSVQRVIRTKLLYWQAQTEPLHFAKPLVQHREATHRFRAGVYRIVVKVVGDEICILRIRHRKDVYKWDYFDRFNRRRIAARILGSRTM